LVEESLIWIWKKMKKEAELEGRVGDGEEDGYDAVVVGSGYGGSVAACRMPIAGIKVCLIEKGRRWEAQDFPTDSLKIMSTVRMKNQNLGIRLGPKDALFQVIFSLEPKHKNENVSTQ
jgi:choline dehydrogenase-like flavoprotein